MTKQDIFNKVATHLFTQGTRATDEGGGCVYLNEGTGHSCAVGGLMTKEQALEADEKAASEWDSSVRTIANIGALPEPLMPHLDLLDSLQCVHDFIINWESTEQMRDALRNVAAAYDLDASIVDTLSFYGR